MDRPELNVYCANCENECSDGAATCPKCGHPLAAAKNQPSAEPRRLTEEDTKAIRQAVIEAIKDRTHFDMILWVMLKVILAGIILTPIWALAGSCYRDVIFHDSTLRN